MRSLAPRLWVLLIAVLSGCSAERNRGTTVSDSHPHAATVKAAPDVPIGRPAGPRRDQAGRCDGGTTMRTASTSSENRSFGSGLPEPTRQETNVLTLQKA